MKGSTIGSNGSSGFYGVSPPASLESPPEVAINRMMKSTKPTDPAMITFLYLTQIPSSSKENGFSLYVFLEFDRESVSSP